MKIRNAHLGKKLTDEHRKKLSDAHRGKRLSAEHIEKIRKSGYGRKHKESSKLKMRLASLGRKNSEETRRKISEANSGKVSAFKGKHHSLETRKKLSDIQRTKTGEKSHNWKGGVTPANKLIRHSFEYRLWRESVFKRDGYTCIWCGAKNGGGKRVVLNADHIKPFFLFPELRFAIDNGRTLCLDCHRKTDTYGASSKLIKKI